MKNYVLTAIALLVLLASTIADAQWRSKTHDEYKALTGVDVKIDGDLGEWDGVLDTGQRHRLENLSAALNLKVSVAKLEPLRNTPAANGTARKITKPAS